MAFAFWTAIALLCSVQTYVSYLVWSKPEYAPVSFALAMRRSFEEWFPWFFLTLLIWRVAGGLRLEQLKIRKWIAIHCALGLGVSCISIAIYSALLHGQKSVDGTIFQFQAMFKKLFVYHLEMDLIIYWLVVMTHHGWHYYLENQERELRASELQRELTRTRLDALRMQLNPHFLFNTLHTISAYIYEKPAAAERIVVRLSELLRLSLEEGRDHEIPLHRELAFLERYLEIERVRFEDRLTVEMKIDPALQNALVPCFILQPVVENAIKHGIEPREDMGQITISAQRRNGTLEIAVADNGAGLSPGGKEVRDGIGLSNTRSRLKHLYGDAQSFDLESPPSGGLVARFVIPYRPSNEC